MEGVDAIDTDGCQQSSTELFEIGTVHPRTRRDRDLLPICTQQKGTKCHESRIDIGNPDPGATQIPVQRRSRTDLVVGRVLNHKIEALIGAQRPVDKVFLHQSSDNPRPCLAV